MKKEGGHNGVLHGASLCCGDERQGWPKTPFWAILQLGLARVRDYIKLNKIKTIKISYPQSTWRAARFARGLSFAIILLIPHGLSNRI